MADQLSERLDHLDGLVEGAGVRAISGYAIEDEVVAWVIENPRPTVVAERDGEVWVLAEVGHNGAGVYPEDDLAEEAELSLPDDHHILWQEDAERAVLARLVGAADASRLDDALARFALLADRVERQLVAVEELEINPVPKGTSVDERGPLVPPSPDHQHDGE